MNSIKVQRSIHIEQPTLLEEAHLRSINYVSNDCDTLMEYVSYGAQRRYHFTARQITDSGYVPPPAEIRRSQDNGHHWEVIQTWQTRKNINGHRFLDISEPNWVLHPKTGALLCLYRTSQSIEGLLPWDEGSPIGITGKMWWKVSFDQGENWSQPKQLVIWGDEYDAAHWAPGIWEGKNSGCIEAVVSVWLDDNQFVVPFSVCTIKGDPSHLCYGGALRGVWTGDQTDPRWKMSDYATVDRSGSNCGGEEPSIALLPDGRLLMTLRVRVDPNDGTTIPSGKFYVVSDDAGRT